MSMIHLQEAKSHEISELQDAPPSMQIQVEEAPAVIKEKDSQDTEKSEPLMPAVEDFKAMLLSERQAAEEGMKACNDAEIRITAELAKKIEDAVQKLNQLQVSVQRIEEKLSKTELEIEKKELENRALRQQVNESLNDEQQIQENEDLLIKCIMQNVGFSRSKPVAACVIYKCLIYWRSFEDERSTLLFDRIIQAIDSAIEVPENNGVLAYWLSNSCTLLLLLKSTSWRIPQGLQESPRTFRPPSFHDSRSRLYELRQAEANCSAFLFEKQLTACLEKIFRMIRDNIKKEISALLLLCIQAPRTSLASSRTQHSQADPIAHWQTIVKSLDSYLETMKQNYVHHFFVSKMLNQIFFFINISLFNSLLLRRECCSFSNGEYVKAGLAELKQWCCNSSVYTSGAWDKLKHIREAIDFVVLHQKSQKTLKEITTKCPVLTIPQLYRISTLYWDNSFCTFTVSPDVLSQMKVRLSEPNLFDSQTFLLEDDLSIPFPMVDIYEFMQQVELAYVDPPPLLRGKSGFMFLLQHHSPKSILMSSPNSASPSTCSFSCQSIPFGLGTKTTAQAPIGSVFGQTSPFGPGKEALGSVLGDCGPGSPPNSAAPATNPFGGPFGNTVNATNSPFTLTNPTFELSRPACISFQSPQPSQLYQPIGLGTFPNAFGTGTTAQTSTENGSVLSTQIGPGKLALGSLFGSFGQSRQLGAGLMGTCFASSSGFGSGFAGTQPTGVFENATAGGGFAGVASTGSGFAAFASGAGSASVASVAAGGFARGGLLGDFGNQQRIGGFSGPGSAGTSKLQSELFTKMRK